MGAGALVELADQFAGGGEHDRIQAAAAVGLPGREDVLGEGGEVPDMDSSLVEVEAERLGPAVAEGEMRKPSAGSVNRCSSVSRTAPWVWAMSRSTPPAPIAASCWSSPTSRTLPPRPTMKVDGGVEGWVSAIPGFVDHHQGRRPNPGPPAGLGLGTR